MGCGSSRNSTASINSSQATQHNKGIIAPQEQQKLIERQLRDDLAKKEKYAIKTGSAVLVNKRRGSLTSSSSSEDEEEQRDQDWENIQLKAKDTHAGVTIPIASAVIHEGASNTDVIRSTIIEEKEEGEDKENEKVEVVTLTLDGEKDSVDVSLSNKEEAQEVSNEIQNLHDHEDITHEIAHTVAGVTMHDLQTTNFRENGVTEAMNEVTKNPTDEFVQHSSEEKKLGEGEIHAEQAETEAHKNNHDSAEIVEQPESNHDSAEIVEQPENNHGSAEIVEVSENDHDTTNTSDVLESNYNELGPSESFLDIGSVESERKCESDAKKVMAADNDKNLNIQDNSSGQIQSGDEINSNEINADTSNTSNATTQENSTNDSDLLQDESNVDSKETVEEEGGEIVNIRAPGSVVEAGSEDLPDATGEPAPIDDKNVTSASELPDARETAHGDELNVTTNELNMVDETVDDIAVANSENQPEPYVSQLEPCDSQPEPCDSQGDNQGDDES